MTPTVAPSLDQLLESDEPAWLWDSARARIAWANDAGTAWFGAQTLFDVIDMVFDHKDQSVAAIAKLGARLPRGQSEIINFNLGNFNLGNSNTPHSLDTPKGILCDCYVHALADGRSGLLVCAQKPSATPSALPPAMQAMALGAFPMALAVVRGSGELVFANDACQQLLGDQTMTGLAKRVNVSFADHLIETSYSTGTASQTLKITTMIGKRDLRVIVRLLEQGERLADASFLTILEDVTERRALEKTLLEGNANHDQPRSKANPIQVADTLSHLKREIETQTRLAEAKNTVPTQPEAPLPAPATAHPAVNLNNEQDSTNQTSPDTDQINNEENNLEGRVPEIVQKTLNDLPQPLVLISHEGEILFANDVSVQLLGARHWRELGEMTTLGDALHILEGEDGEISLFTMQDEPLNLEVMMSSFPWKDGAVFQATLSPSDDGERADNRRKENFAPNDARNDTSGDDVKKNAEITPEGEANRVTNIALSSSDNVVSFRRENEQEADGQTDALSNGARNPNDEDLRAILDTATDGIITLDSKGKICSFSAGAEALFGYNANDVFGKAFKKLMVRSSRKVITQYIAALSGDGLASVFNDGREVEAQVKQGGEISLFVTIGKMANARLDIGRLDIGRLDMGRSVAGHGGEGTAAFCVVVRDITQRKKTEADLRQAKEKAEQSSERKSNFLANISHELRTPLNAIMGFSEVMLSQRFGEIENKKYLGYANDIHTSGAHLLSLINDLLDLSKVEAGKLELNFTGVNLLNEVDEALHTLQDQADQKRVLLSKAFKGGLPNVVADLRSIKQVLLNLLSNAIKFTESGGQVTASVKLDETGEMILSIKDNGRGMSRSQLKRALEPFEQIEPASGGEQTGTGLGLPLTKALVEANRAKFSIISAPKKGTLVEVVFPTTRVLAE